MEALEQLEEARTLLKQHREFVHKKEALRANEDEAQRKIEELPAVQPAELPRLVELLMQNLAAHTTTLRSIDDRVDLLFEQNLNDRISMLEAVTQQS